MSSLGLKKIIRRRKIIASYRTFCSNTSVSSACVFVSVRDKNWSEVFASIRVSVKWTFDFSRFFLLQILHQSFILFLSLSHLILRKCNFIFFQRHINHFKLMLFCSFTLSHSFRLFFPFALVSMYFVYIFWFSLSLTIRAKNEVGVCYSTATTAANDFLTYARILK